MRFARPADGGAGKPKSGRPEEKAMAVQTVGMLSPGEMGGSLGKTLRQNGLNVITSLAGRSELTRLRAAEADIRDVGSLDAVVKQSDLVMSVLVPAEAEAVVEAVAASMQRTGSRPVFADCNATARQTAMRIGARILDAGATFVDAGICGRRIYCSGPATEAFESLRDHGLDIRRVGPEIGQASGLKMLHSATTKGTRAMWIELLTAARAMGLSDALSAELAEGPDMVTKALIDNISHEPKRSRRMIGELEEVALTFQGLGLTPRMLEGAADMHRLISATPLADQSPREPDPSLDAILDALAGQLRETSPSGR